MPEISSVAPVEATRFVVFDTPLLAALPEEAREALGATIPFPPRLGLRRSTPSSLCRSPRTRCSTARSSASTARCARRRSRRP